ncbi:MAG: LysR substrate-binding domain-containing protein [Bdellovibrio sp.]|jgi:DNA-binding transcriptional LysR family regulator
MSAPRYPTADVKNLSLLNFQHLILLKELKKHTSLRSVCGELGLSVSNISREIRHLETLLEVNLIKTSSRGYTITENGLACAGIAETLLVKAEGLFGASDLKVLSQRVSHTVGGRGYLNLLATQNFSSNAELVKSASFCFLDLSPAETVQLTVLGLLDSIIHFETYDLPASWETRALIKDVQWGLHLRKNHPLTKVKDVSMQELLRYPFVVSSAWNGREVAFNNDFFPEPWSKRQKGFQAQTALMALQIAKNTDQIVFLPDIFKSLVSFDHLCVLDYAHPLFPKKDLLMSVHAARVSSKLLEKMLESFRSRSLS